MSNNTSVYQSIRFQVNNAVPGQRIGVRLIANGVQVSFTTGEPLSNQSGLQISSQSGQLPLQMLDINSDEISIITSSQGGGAPQSFTISLWLAGESGISSFYLESFSDPGVEISASVGNSAPQIVNASPTLFQWS